MPAVATSDELVRQVLQQAQLQCPACLDRQVRQAVAHLRTARKARQVRPVPPQERLQQQANQLARTDLQVLRRTRLLRSRLRRLVVEVVLVVVPLVVVSS